MSHRASARQARLAVFALFASFGIVLSTWAVYLPSVKHAVGMSTAMTGTMLLLLGVGSVVGMQITGVLIDRIGGEPIAPLGGAAMALALAIPLSAHTLSRAMLGALLLGLVIGTADVAMNAAGINVQRDYARPIMAAFHGTFSVGTVVGSLLGAGAFALRLNETWSTAAVEALCLLLVAFAWYGLRGRAPQAPAGDDDEEPTPPQPREGHRRRVVVLGMLAFFLLLSEGSAMDWGSLHAQQRLGATPAVGAITVGTFLVAMTLSRFTVDRVTHRVGAVRVLRCGTLVAAVGITIVMLTDTIPLVLCGWAVFGLGLAVGVPQVFTAAGNLNEHRSGRTLSRVVGLGYVAILAGPALMGWLIELASWTGAFLVPLGAVLVCACAASAVAADG